MIGVDGFVLPGKNNVVTVLYGRNSATSGCNQASNHGEQVESFVDAESRVQTISEIELL